MKYISTIILSIAFNFNTLRAQPIIAIDSSYLNAMNQFSKNVTQITDSVWPGMQIGPYCIFRFNGPAFITYHSGFNGENTPSDSIYVLNARDYGLMGATQTNIKGKLVAHNDYGQKRFISINSFYSELFHELHHVYQRQYIKNLIYDNPAEMLTYPENPENDAIKLYENEVLLNLIHGDPEKLNENINLFYTCRNERKRIIGEKYSNYEKAVESIEGPAMYCEYMYMNRFSTSIADKAYIQNRFFYSLIESTYGRDALRSKHLLTGMVQCILLSRHYPGWQKEYYSSGSYLNDFFFAKFRPQITKLPDLTYYKSKAEFFTNIELQKHQKELYLFNNQNGIRITLNFKTTPDFRGFDPMHAEAITDSVILHTTLLKLAQGNNFLNFYSHKVVTIIKGQVWFVNQAIFYLDKKDLSVSNNRIKIKTENIDIDWEYKTNTKKNNSYSFDLN